MLFRIISKPSHLYRLLTSISAQTHLINPNPISHSSIFPNPTHYFAPKTPHLSFYSTNGANGGSDSTTDLWNMSSEADQDSGSVFDEEPVNLEGIHDHNGDEMRSEGGGDKIGGVEKKWSVGVMDKEAGVEDVFGADLNGGEIGFTGRIEEDVVEGEKSEEAKQLELEEKALIDVIKGPNRSFGDLIASSGITDEMLDSLIALKDFEGIKGLPPLSEIEDMRYEKNSGKASRDEIERLKQEEVAKARVQQVDEKGRAYGTGKRKCSIARVWIQPGEGKFVVNDKEFDSYFPMLDHRAALLRPFSETKTLGMWDVSCTVKGGGTSGQVGAIRLGISRALQNWEPGLRPPLKEAGFLTRDSRVVERKKPGKAKARKSFQWVKR